jgi:hypothetical protein
MHLKKMERKEQGVQGYRSEVYNAPHRVYREALSVHAAISFKVKN